MTRESDIEAALVRRVRDDNGIAYKFVSPGRVGVPDRLCLRPVPKAHQAIVAQYVQFVETKAPNVGVVPNSPQEREHDRLRKMGFSIEVHNRE